MSKDIEPILRVLSNYVQQLVLSKNDLGERFDLRKIGAQIASLTGQPE